MELFWALIKEFLSIIGSLWSLFNCPRVSVLPRSIVNWTLEIEETAAWRNDCLVHIYSLHFLHFPQPFTHLSLFSQITKEILFLKAIHVFKFSLVDVLLIKRGNRKRNPQTRHWIRASQTAQSQGCLFAFISTPVFKKFLVPWCSFLLPKMPWRTEISAIKSFTEPCSVCFRFFGKLI